MKKIILIALTITVSVFSAKAQSKKSPCSSVITSAYQSGYNNPAIVNNTGYTVIQPAIIHPYTRHHIRVWTDDMNNPYEGLPSQQNDGVKTNENRNMNVTITSFGGNLPASDGTMPY